MKQRIKVIVLTLLTLGILTLATGCGNEETPYQKNDAENYTVSVKYDANGGTFTTNTSVIVDSYNISENNQIALLSPDNKARENDAFTAVKNGYFLAGWYAERTEAGTDKDGNTIYTYGEKWDFETDLLEVDKNKTYTSSEPVMTLYAAWIPLYEIEFYDLGTGELLDRFAYDPTLSSDISIPAWDEETGTIEMFDFPEKKGYTFQGVYLDKEGKESIATDTIAHTGKVNYVNGTANDLVMRLYVKWIEGEWYRIYNAKQLIDNASVTGCYEIYEDLDFANSIWPTSLMYGNFAGTIRGNGHTLKNIEVVQTNNSKVNAGLFGTLTEAAEITDVTFENVTVTIKSGTRVNGTNYGLFAGTISDKATISNVSIVGSTLKIDSGCYFGVNDYSIGLLCGMGNTTAVPNAQIRCEATGDTPQNLQITIDGNEVTLEIITQ